MTIRGGARWRAWTIVALVACLTVTAVAAAAAVEPNPNQDAPRLEQRRAQPQTTVDAVSRTVMCPSCDTTLDQSDSPAAERMRAWVIAAVEAGWTRGEIRAGLVREYGGDESVLAAPRARGAGLVAWMVPAGIGFAALASGLAMVRRWRRADAQTPRSSWTHGSSGA